MASFFEGNSDIIKTLIKYGGNVDHMSKVLTHSNVFTMLPVQYFKKVPFIVKLHVHIVQVQD